MALTNAPLEGSDVHTLDKIDHDRLSVAEEGALEVSEHLERVSERERKTAKKKPAAAASTRRASTARKAASKKTTSAKKPAARRSASKRTASRAPRAAGGERARDVAAELLKKGGGEMAVSDLAAKVVSSGRTQLGGKTPAATVAAQIYTAAKNGVLFKKTSRGKVALLGAKAKA